MKRFLPPLFIGIFFLVLQTTWLSSFPSHRIRLDLLLIFTIYIAFLLPSISGGFLVFLMGYLMDVFSGNTIGFYAFSRPLIFLAALFFKERFYLEGIPFQFLFAFIIGTLEEMLILMFFHVLQPEPPGSLLSMFLTSSLPQAFFTGLVTPLFFLAFQKRALFFLHPRKKGIRRESRSW